MTNCWWPKTFQLFIMCTIEALLHTFCLRLGLQLLSSSHLPVEEESWSCKIRHTRHFVLRRMLKEKIRHAAINRQHCTLILLILSVNLELKLRVVSRCYCLCVGLFIEDPILGTWQGVKKPHTQIQLSSSICPRSWKAARLQPVKRKINSQAQMFLLFLREISHFMHL